MIIASKALILEQGRILLTLQGNPIHVSLPGGKVEPGEEQRRALYREVLEETGCTPTNVVYLGKFLWQDYETHVYSARLSAFSFIQRSEILGIAWFPVEYAMCMEFDYGPWEKVLSVLSPESTVKGNIEAVARRLKDPTVNLQ